ncbi:hypothetical protein [Hymenobacter chitinivorans]|uniref:Uncharacterized protein n=1 Tax=Hymenobacter chitinivorans DSM 11115 TaxID=1121954 RepID=A0A2M9BM63_9BACT|nr:hypothetical protein [Hymenobacter chitinivorans]PJJ59015.1 hypothetical protein CLV45_0428 [Hymenobacter chitinivorans DSM 11115]
MQLYSYWARTTLDCQNVAGHWFHLIAYTGSDESVVAAQAAGQQLLQERHSRLLHDEPLHDYPSGTAPLREQLEQRIVTEHGELIAALTRNRYGSLVLNAPRVMFLDVDSHDLLEPPRPARQQPGTPFSWLGFLRNLFAPAPPPPPPAPAPPQPDALAQLEMRLAAWLQLHPEWNFRLYRTRLGFRLLVTHQLLGPGSAEAQQVFAAMRTDAIYVRLCQSQNCYRARLTPKPWRIGWQRPAHPFPYDTAEQVQQQRQWEQEYARRSQDFSVCELVGEYGSGTVTPEARQLTELHDAACLGGRKLA